MSLRHPIRAPTSGPIPDRVRVPSTAKSLTKSLIRLSKPSLIALALQWLQEENVTLCSPYLLSNRNWEEELDEDYLWTPVATVEELRLTYNRMRFEASISKRHIVDRILDGDWRRGLSLYQVATIDLQYLSENDKALRWSALKLVPADDDQDAGMPPSKKKRRTTTAPYPTISPISFLGNLQHEITPLVKAHYHLAQLHTSQNLSIVRVFVAESPYTTSHPSFPSPLFTDQNRLIFIALPDSCPYIYVSVSGSTKESSSMRTKPSSTRMDVTSLKRTVLEAIPRAFSKFQHRYSLESTSLTARSLSAMLTLRGNNGSNAANGAYTVFSRGVVDDSPISTEHMHFAQKIVGPGEGKHGTSDNLSLSQLSLKHREQKDNTSNVLVSKSEKDLESRKIATAARFGMTGFPQTTIDGTEPESCVMKDDLDRLQIRLDEDLSSRATDPSNEVNARQNLFESLDQSPSEQSDSGILPCQATASMTLTFQGGHVLLGIRKLVEDGLIDLDKLPAWMTGEEAVSGGTVRRGTVVRGKGGGA